MKFCQADQFGTATITVTVEDGGLDNDLATPDDNGSINRTVVQSRGRQRRSNA